MVPTKNGPQLHDTILHSLSWLRSSTVSESATTILVESISALLWEETSQSKWEGSSKLLHSNTSLFLSLPTTTSRSHLERRLRAALFYFPRHPLERNLKGLLQLRPELEMLHADGTLPQELDAPLTLTLHAFGVVSYNPRYSIIEAYIACYYKSYHNDSFPPVELPVMTWKSLLCITGWKSPTPKQQFSREFLGLVRASVDDFIHLKFRLGKPITPPCIDVPIALHDYIVPHLKAAGWLLSEASFAAEVVPFVTWLPKELELEQDEGGQNKGVEEIEEIGDTLSREEYYPQESPPWTDEVETAWRLKSDTLHQRTLPHQNQAIRKPPVVRQTITQRVGRWMRAVFSTGTSMPETIAV